MRAFVRAAFAAALVLLLSAPTIAADKVFKRDDLAEAAIKLEAQIKADSGQVTKSIAELRRDVDAAFQRGDDRGGVRILGQIVVVAPNRTVTWLRLARDLRQIRPNDDPQVAQSDARVSLRRDPVRIRRRLPVAATRARDAPRRWARHASALSGHVGGVHRRKPGHRVLRHARE